MINNLELIKTLIDFPNEDTFYKVEVIIRRKDNPGLLSNTKLVKTYYITSAEKLDLLFEKEIKPICDVLNARASFYLNKRSFEKTAFASLKQTVDCIMTHDYKAVKRAYNSACGKTCNGGDDKRWLFDLDEKDEETVKLIKKFVEIVGGKVYAVIPTKHGYHVITSVFNLQNFWHMLEVNIAAEPSNTRLLTIQKMDIHKDNGTILYIPDNENE